MKKQGALLICTMLMAGCNSAASQKNDASELADRHFFLSSVDGKAIGLPEGMKPGIHFSSEMRVSGVMCNRFFGQGKLADGVLSVPQMAATRKLCSDPRLNEWDRTVGEVLTKGAALTLEQQTLTLEGAGHKLVYVAER